MGERGGKQTGQSPSSELDADSDSSCGQGTRVSLPLLGHPGDPGHTSLPFLLFCGPDAQLLSPVFSPSLQLHPPLTMQTLRHLWQCLNNAQGITQNKEIKRKPKSLALKKKKITLCVQEAVWKQSAHNIPHFPRRAPRLFGKVRRRQTR